MEKAILQTLIYADIFDYPLKAWEIHKWLIKKEADLPEVERGLVRLLNRGKIVEKKGYFVLAGRVSLVRKRLAKQNSSDHYFGSAKAIARLFKLIPWIQLVGISGNLAMDNAAEDDDIDLFVISQKRRLWLTRISMLLILALLEKRRRKNDDRKKAAGKFCLNLLIEEDQLEQSRKDLYIAHEVLQMKPLWERNKLYGKFLQANFWAFDYLPNWLTGVLDDSEKALQFDQGSRIINWLENVLQFLQLRYMGIPASGERVSSVAVYFHPEDMQPKVLKEFEKRCKKYGVSKS